MFAANLLIPWLFSEWESEWVKWSEVSEWIHKVPINRMKFILFDIYLISTWGIYAEKSHYGFKIPDKLESWPHENQIHNMDDFFKIGVKSIGLPVVIWKLWWRSRRRAARMYTKNTLHQRPQYVSTLFAACSEMKRVSEWSEVKWIQRVTYIV